jgi:hypothetical protein
LCCDHLNSLCVSLAIFADYDRSASFIGVCNVFTSRLMINGFFPDANLSPFAHVFTFSVSPIANGLSFSVASRNAFSFRDIAHAQARGMRDFPQESGDELFAVARSVMHSISDAIAINQCTAPRSHVGDQAVPNASYQLGTLVPPE